MASEKLGPCVLEGRFVRLEPLRPTHATALLEAAKGVDWSWFLRPARTPDEVGRRIVDGMSAEAKGEEYAFAVLLKETGRVVGTTAYLAVVPRHRAVEIGSTWYSPDVQGTFVNPECKFLLLRRAFEEWGAIRIQLGTDSKNVHSQRAIARLGAKLEGTLRNHRKRPDGSVRDTMMYSMVASEWPAAKAGLVQRIGAFDPPTPATGPAPSASV